ncbi:Fic family protein [Brachybacterium sp. GCM10030267]
MGTDHSHADAASPVASSLPVPPIGQRAGTWTVPDTGLHSRRARTAGTGRYHAAVPARLAESDWRVPSDLAADVADAESALVALDRDAATSLPQTGGASPSRGPVLGPMSAILLRTESASSSQIEDLTVGARQLALAELQESASANARVVVANVRAMESAIALSRRLDVGAVLTMQHALLGEDAVHGRSAGGLREQLVWIGRNGHSPVGAVFVAPEPADVPAAMEDLMAFVGREDLPVLLHAALAHAQFETIHPFTDGNGRTGRALVHAMLHGKGLLSTLAPPISAGLLRELEGYTDSLTAFRAGDARPVVERFAQAARYAAATGRQLIGSLSAQLDGDRRRLGGLRPQAAGWRLLPLLVGQPVLNAAYVRSALGTSDTTAQRAISQLADAGILTERTGASRNRVWQHSGILDILDEYAEAIRRPG